jgi:hypothetical protein
MNKNEYYEYLDTWPWETIIIEGLSVVFRATRLKGWRMLVLAVLILSGWWSRALSGHIVNRDGGRRHDFAGESHNPVYLLSPNGGR